MNTNQSMYILLGLLMLCVSVPALQAQNIQHTLYVNGNEFATEPVISLNGSDLRFDFTEPRLRIEISGVIDYSISSNGVQLIIDSPFIDFTNIGFIPGNNLDCGCLTLNYQAQFYSTAAGSYLLQGNYAGYGIGMADDTVQMNNLVINYECPPGTIVQVQNIIPETHLSLGHATVAVTQSGLPYSLQIGTPSGFISYVNQMSLQNFEVNSKSGTAAISLIDRFGCQHSENFTIPRCTIPVTTQIPVPDCDGQIAGSLIVTPSNDYTPYSYTWSGPSNPGNASTITNPVPGTYQLTVTDAIGCTEQKTMVVPSKTPLTVSCKVLSAVTRIGAIDGKAEVNLAGGTAPYRLYWSGTRQGSKSLTQTGTTSITNLTAGDYTLQIVDKDGCSEFCTLNIPDVPCSLKWSTITTSNPSCPGTGDGSIIPQTSSGVVPVSFTLTRGSTTWTTSPFHDLAVGSYSLSATDDLGCQIDTTIIITDPPALTLECSLYFPVNFYNGDNGVIALELSGGTPPYNVSYQTEGKSGNQIFQFAGQNLLSGLIAGDYDILVTDSKGCQISCSTTVPTFLCLFQGEAAIEQPDCNQPGGTISISLQDALQPVQYFWSGPTDPGNTGHASGLSAGDYSIELVDYRGCRDTVSGTIRPFVPLEMTCAVLQQETGWHYQDGVVQVNWTGLDTLVSLYLTGADTVELTTNQDSFILHDLSPGEYIIDLFQGDSCTASCSFAIVAYTCATSYHLITTPPSCSNSVDGKLTIQLEDSLVYTLALNDTLVYSLDGSFELSGLSPGSHVVSTSFADGCSFVDTVIIIAPDSLYYSAELNPASDSTTADGSIYLDIRGGNPPYQVIWSDQLTGDLREGLTAGAWSFTIQDARGCLLSDVLLLKSNDLLCAGLINQTTVVDASCPAAVDGSILIVPENGSAPYIINWEDGSTAFERADLRAGTYRYAWVDALGCSVEDSVVVGFQDSLLYVEVVSLCPGTSITFAGQVLSAPGSYVHTYLNQWGCDSLVELMVLPIDLPEPLHIEVMEPSQCKNQDGSIQIETNGMFPGHYLINGQDPVAQPNFTGLGVGSYTIQYDLNGCSTVLVDSLVLSAQEPAWHVEIDTLYQPICGLPLSGAVRIRLVGATDDEVMVRWSNGQEGLFADFLDPGIYQVTLTGTNGCFQQAEVIVPNSGESTLSIEPHEYSLCVGNALQLNLDTTWQYHWTGPDLFSSDSSSVILRAAGTYRVTAQQEGCTVVDSILLKSLDDYFEASFLVPQQVLAGQPFVAVENSWPVPDSIRWEVEGGAAMNGTNLNQLSLLMPDPDTAVVRLTAWKGACSVTLEKIIIAYSDTSALTNPLFSQPSEIISARLMPNPNQGVFRVVVALSEVMPAQLRIYDPQGTLKESRNVAGLDQYEVSFELVDLQPGLYTLAVQTAGDWKTVPFIVIL